MVCSSGGTQHPTTPHSSLVQIMTFKSALTVASIALIATASSLAMAAPSEAKDGCGRRFKFSNHHGQCILKNKFRGKHQAPIVIRPVIRPVVVRPMIQPVIRPIFRPVIRPAVRPLIHPVVLHPYAQPSSLSSNRSQSIPSGDSQSHQSNHSDCQSISTNDRSTFHPQPIHTSCLLSLSSSPKKTAQSAMAGFFIADHVTIAIGPGPTGHGPGH